MLEISEPNKVIWQWSTDSDGQLCCTRYTPDCDITDASQDVKDLADLEWTADVKKNFATFLAEEDASLLE